MFSIQLIKPGTLASSIVLLHLCAAFLTGWGGIIPVGRSRDCVHKNTVYMARNNEVVSIATREELHGISHGELCTSARKE